MPTIYLRVDKGQLRWSSDYRTWGEVNGNFPKTGIKPGELLIWEGDHTIKSIKVKLDKGSVIPKVDEDDSKIPFGRMPMDAGTEPRSDKYTLIVQPADGGKPIVIDPEIKTPPDNGQ